MKRKLVFLPEKYSKEIVDTINGYFNMGYEIEDKFSAYEGCYFLLVLDINKHYDLLGQKYPSFEKCTLLEEKYDKTWTSTNTQDVGNN
jgi:hypothetical protein